MTSDENVLRTGRDGYIFKLPSRVPGGHLIGAAAGLLMLQLFAGTDAIFALLVFTFVLIAGAAFNFSGGMTTIPGFSLTMVALKIVVISQVAKVLYWQPADSYLEVPIETMAALLLGMASMLLGYGVTRNLARRAWLQPIADERKLYVGTLICTALGTVAALVVIASSSSDSEGTAGGIAALAALFARCLPLGIVFATAFTIVRTQGRRSFSFLVFMALALSLCFAISQGTKQGIFETVAYYFLTCVAWKFSFRRKHLVALGIVGVIGLVVIWPVIQSLKDIYSLTDVSGAEKFELIVDSLGEMSSLDEFIDARENISAITSNERFEYYGRPAGWLDRFSLIEQVDELVLATLQQGELGWYTLNHAARTLLPTFIDPEKPTRDTGNLLGKRIGFLAEWDEKTQVAFGVIAESFAAFTWLGVVLVPAFLMALFNIVIGRLSGPYLANVWTVYLFGRLQHTFVEQTALALVRDLVFTPLMLFAVAFAIRTATSSTSTDEPRSSSNGLP